MMRIASWNVNGIRSVSGKGFFDWLQSSGADVVCIQETKARPEQLGKPFSEFMAENSWTAWWSSAQRPGYSGVSIWSRIPVDSVTKLGDDRFDSEGRVLVADLGHTAILSCYFPNSQDAGARLDYKLAFCDALLQRCDALRKEGKEVVICGDFNIAHKPIDLEYPEANVESPGYLPEERAWMDNFVSAGWVDSFREFDPSPKRYSWWSYRSNARERNIGWRLDYICTSPGLKRNYAAARIQSQVFGSDHCPVSLDLNLPIKDLP